MNTVMKGCLNVADGINRRKTEHIELCLTDAVEGVGKTTGLDGVHFIHNALPEIAFADISLESELFGKKTNTPFLVSSMTGGSPLAEAINTHLAEAAEERGWAVALGSTRALLESDAHQESFLIRKHAPTVPVIANLGAVQLNYGYDASHCNRIVERTEADSLVLHLNSLQEVIQDGGNLNFKDLLPKIEAVCAAVDVPVGVKEVGFGIDGTVAKQLADVGISYIDVAGAGGTSWSQVEKLRTDIALHRQAAEAFNDWGIPTRDCLVSVRRQLPDIPLFASGGMKTGVDAAKAMTLGADVVGFARQLLEAATDSTEAVLSAMEQIEFELKMTMFGIGAKSLTELQETNRVEVLGNSLMDEL